MKYKKLSDGQWAEIKVKHCSGITAKELGEMFGIPYRTIQDKCNKEEWPTPSNLRKQAERALEQADAIEGQQTKDAILKKWQNRKEQHREKMFTELSKKLDDPETWANLRLKNAHDIERIDAVLRRTVGLEENVTKEEKMPISMNLFQQITVATPEQIEQAQQPSDVVDI